MRMTDLRWGHMARVLSALEQGQSTPDAVTAAGIGPRVWRQLRADWTRVGRHLAQVDPHGAPVNLWAIDALVHGNRSKGGRPRGAQDTRPRARGEGRRARGTGPAAQGTGQLASVEGHWFCDE